MSHGNPTMRMKTTFSADINRVATVLNIIELLITRGWNRYIIDDGDHTYECLDVDMAWNYGERDLKSVFSAKLCLVSLKFP